MGKKSNEAMITIEMNNVLQKQKIAQTKCNISNIARFILTGLFLQGVPINHMGLMRRISK